MDWITDTIAIGNYIDAGDRQRREAEGIRSMICLNNKQRGVQAQAIGLEALANFDFIDGPGNSPDMFERAVLAVGKFAVQYPKLLVQCHAGRSRSVVVVAAHFMRANGWNPRQALAFVTLKRESAVADGLDRLLRSAFLFEAPKPGA